ncbi:MAG: Smr/MutS family protein, partial [Candidatus Rokubacteria bacterium]|nr:Smr/MutS family protein [Candidatus Rokubacteria bacterium]
AEPAGAAPATLALGQRVAAAHLGVSGELVAIAGDAATVRSGAITVRVPLQALRPVDAGVAASGRAGFRAKEAAPSPRPIPAELLLLGQTTDEARDHVEQYLDDAFLAGLATVRLVHGKGTGALRKAVRDLLAGHPLVDSFRDGEPSEGGAGATVAALKVS